jgi:hypothetical protein
MTPMDFLSAARVPHSLEPQEFGTWQIERRSAGDTILGELGREQDLPYGLVGWPDYTLLRRWTDRTIHLPFPEIVMEDSLRELRRHLPIWLAASGRVLKTGLGLGCVVRGLLVNPAVEHVDVVEIDADICRIIGHEFVSNPRITIHHADALTWDFGDRRWDYAWHDLHSFNERDLQLMHGDLIARFLPAVALPRQGAWAFPRAVGRRFPARMLGMPRDPRYQIRS